MIIVDLLYLDRVVVSMPKVRIIQDTYRCH